VGRLQYRQAFPLPLRTQMTSYPPFKAIDSENRSVPPGLGLFEFSQLGGNRMQGPEDIEFHSAPTSDRDGTFVAAYEWAPAVREA
jgi:hypothetical protein